MKKIVDRKSWAELDTEERAKTGTRKTGVSQAAKLTEAVAKAFGIPFKEHSYLWTLSTDQVDRYLDVIEVPGWKMKNFFEGGSPVLWAHNKGADGSQNQNPPIGTMLHLWMETGKDAGKNRLRGIRNFHRETELSRDIAKLVEIDVLRTSSVGFIPEDVAERKDANGDWAGGFTFKKQDLLEDSVTPIPANPGAVVGAKSVNEDFKAYRLWVEQTIEEGDYENETKTLLQKLIVDLNAKTTIVVPEEKEIVTLPKGEVETFVRSIVGEEIKKALASAPPKKDEPEIQIFEF